MTKDTLIKLIDVLILTLGDMKKHIDDCFTEKVKAEPIVNYEKLAEKIVEVYKTNYPKKKIYEHINDIKRIIVDKTDIMVNWLHNTDNEEFSTLFSVNTNMKVNIMLAAVNNYNGIIEQLLKEKYEKK